jgi:hypothetical protein
VKFAHSPSTFVVTGTIRVVSVIEFVSLGPLPLINGAWLPFLRWNTLRRKRNHRVAVIQTEHFLRVICRRAVARHRVVGSQCSCQLWDLTASRACSPLWRGGFAIAIWANLRKAFPERVSGGQPARIPRAIRQFHTTGAAFGSPAAETILSPS